MEHSYINSLYFNEHLFSDVNIVEIGGGGGSDPYPRNIFSIVLNDFKIIRDISFGLTVPLLLFSIFCGCLMLCEMIDRRKSVDSGRYLYLIRLTLTNAKYL